MAIYNSIPISTLKIFSALKVKKFRQKYHLFIAEGSKIASELIAHHPHLIHSLIVLNDDRIAFDSEPSFDVYYTNEKNISRVTHFSSPPPIIAICNIKKYLAIQSDFSNDGFEILLDGLNDPGNIGTIIRTAEWLGFEKVLVTKSSIDLFNPKLITATMGSFFRMKIEIVEDLDTYHWKKPLYGADMQGTSLQELKFHRTGTLCIGNESHGLSPQIRKKIDQKIVISSASSNQAESLNASIAAGILMYAIKNQQS